MSDQDTSKEPQVTSNQPIDTGHDSSELATSSNKWDRKSVLLAVLFGLLPAASLVIYFWTGAERNDPKIHWLPISLMLTIIFVIILFLWKKIWLLKNISQFNSWIFGVTLIGGTIAFLLPLGITNDFTKDGEGTALRQMLIYTTGGLLGVITLSETRRKNDQEKKKNKDEKKKNKQDHIRQVYAERRSRYAKAIEQLANEKASIRLGGIYTLVGLVDEWLTDKSVKDKDDRHKEGQVIINNLCSYIRSPFPLAEKIEEYDARNKLKELKKKDSKSLSSMDSWQLKNLNERFTDTNDEKKLEQITAEYAKIQEEQGVRRTIFVEMSKRSSTLSNDKKDINPGPWSKFDFDFSQSQIFYPLNDITIEKPQFIASRFYGKADFRNTIFPHDQNFTRAIFNESPIINEVQFARVLNLSGAIFLEEMKFIDIKFKQKIKFDGARFEKGLYMLNVEFHQDALFEETEFKDAANFNRSTFMQNANFSKTYFNHDAEFSGVTFKQNANFSKTYFNHDAEFSGATFKQNANFRWAAFKQNAEFSGAKFTQAADFYGAAFSANPPKFMETFEDSDETC